MTCDLCSKNEATVHLTEVVNKETRELHLCESCAREKGAEAVEQFGAASPAGAEQLTSGLAELLAGLTDLGAKLPGGAAARAISCPSCGLTYEDFKKNGRLGCGACYEAFRKVLAPLLKRIHGATDYPGKVPPAAAQAKLAEPKQDVPKLKEQLKTAVAAESFEEAAKLRDKIRTLEGRKKGEGPKVKGEGKS